MKEYCDGLLKSGQAVPIYGYAVLRKTYPLSTCQSEPAKKMRNRKWLVENIEEVIQVKVMKDLQKLEGENVEG